VQIPIAERPDKNNHLYGGLVDFNVKPIGFFSHSVKNKPNFKRLRVNYLGASPRGIKFPLTFFVLLLIF